MGWSLGLDAFRHFAPIHNRALGLEKTLPEHKRLADRRIRCRFCLHGHAILEKHFLMRSSSSIDRKLFHRLREERLPGFRLRLLLYLSGFGPFIEFKLDVFNVQRCLLLLLDGEAGGFVVFVI
jgi:hypothetical protein